MAPISCFLYREKLKQDAVILTTDLSVKLAKTNEIYFALKCMDRAIRGSHKLNQIPINTPGSHLVHM